MKTLKYDIVIIGAGMYGLHAAHYLSNYNLKVLIIESDKEIMSRASLVNQARLHNGMHYPRGIKTIKSILQYRDKFMHDYSFAINRNYEAYYAVAKNNSLTDEQSFEKIMSEHGVPFTLCNPNLFFRDDTVSGLYKTNEYSYSRDAIKDFFEYKLRLWNNVDITFLSAVKRIEYSDCWLTYFDDNCISSRALINTTYASSNYINMLAGQPLFNVKYQLCETVLCKISSSLRDVGITIMDGNFFSLMPFGFTDCHTLTSVQWTPHEVIFDGCKFACMSTNNQCIPLNWSNCNNCKYRPNTRYDKMLSDLEYFMLPELINLKYNKSQFAIKAISKDVERTDDRETIISFDAVKSYLSVLSGKFFTFYSMDKYLDHILSNFGLV
jgi:hypothetical protein